MCTGCKRIPTIELIKYTYNLTYLPIFVIVVLETLKFYYIRKSQLHNTLLLTITTMLHIRS